METAQVQREEDGMSGHCTGGSNHGGTSLAAISKDRCNRTSLSFAFSCMLAPSFTHQPGSKSACITTSAATIALAKRANHHVAPVKLSEAHQQRRRLLTLDVRHAPRQ